MHTHLNHPSRRLSYSSSGIDACVCLPLCVCVCVRLTPQLAFSPTLPRLVHTLIYKTNNCFQLEYETLTTERS